MNGPVISDDILGFGKQISPSVLSRAANEIEEAFCANRPRGHLVVYNNDCERGKFTCEKPDEIGPGTTALFEFLQSEKFTTAVRKALELDVDLEPAPRGAGAQMTAPNGYLAPHLDYAVHPSGKERRANAILFLNAYWPSHGGGELVFYYPDCVTPRYVIEPQFGRMVLWESSDEAYHGVSQVTCAMRRITAAMYYLARPRRGATRVRALFAPHRGK